MRGMCRGVIEERDVGLIHVVFCETGISITNARNKAKMFIPMQNVEYYEISENGTIIIRTLFHEIMIVKTKKTGGKIILERRALFNIS